MGVGVPCSHILMWVWQSVSGLWAWQSVSWWWVWQSYSIVGMHLSRDIFGHGSGGGMLDQLLVKHIIIIVIHSSISLGVWISVDY